MKVTVNLNDIVLEKEISITTKHKGLFNNQGMPIYEVEEITGKIYFDKETLNNLVSEEIKKQALNSLVYNIEIVFICKQETICNNGFYHNFDVCGELKEDDNENVYFENFEIV